MTWRCQRCARTVEPAAREDDHCAACAIGIRAGRRMRPDDDVAGLAGVMSALPGTGYTGEKPPTLPARTGDLLANVV